MPEQTNWVEKFEARIFPLIDQPWKVALIAAVGALGLTALLSQVLFAQIAPRALAFATVSAGLIGYLVAVSVLRYIRVINTQREELGKLNAELNAYAYTVAHDLKNPLNGIVGYSRILQDPRVTPEIQQRTAEKILDSCERMQDIIDALLVLATLRDESITFGSLDMCDIIKTAWDDLHTMRADYDAQLLMPDELPDSVGYKPWVSEIWSNYLSNAIKYGGRPPEVKVGADRLPNGMIRYWVRDNGKGIDLASRTDLFAEFSNTSITKMDGHGLGLSIARRIATRLGGEVGVESKPGSGSTFYFTLPEG